MTPDRVHAPGQTEELEQLDARRNDRANDQDSSLVRGRHAGRSDATQLLALQAMAGNRAVSTLVQRAGSSTVVEHEAPESEAPESEADESKSAPSGPEVAPEADGGANPGDLPGSVPESGGDEAKIQAEVNRQVGALPEAPQELDQAEAAQERGRRDGEQARDELGIEGRPALAQFIEAQAAQEDGSPPPSKLEQFASWAGGGLRSAGSSIASGARTAGSGIASAARAVGGFFAGIGRSISNFFSRDKNLDKTKGGEQFNTSRRADKVANAARSGGAKATSGTGAVGTGLKQFGAVSTGTASVISKVTGAVGIFFASIQAAFDIRALISSRTQVKNFDQMYKDAQESGIADEEVLKAVKFAMEQKYSKQVKRAISVVGGMMSIAAGAGLLAITLASNPVGWFVLAAIAGVGAIIGLGLGIYKFARWLKKPASELGKKRRDAARQLILALNFGDPLAINVIRELHLEPAQLRAEENDIAIEIVAEKLKSA